MNTNDISNKRKPTYSCAICGKTFDSILERTSCEMNCLKQQEEEEKRAVEVKYREERSTRHNEVTAAIKNAAELLEKYLEDYGEYEYDGSCANNIAESFSFKKEFPINKLYHHFWF